MIRAREEGLRIHEERRTKTPGVTQHQRSVPTLKDQLPDIKIGLSKFADTRPEECVLDHQVRILSGCAGRITRYTFCLGVLVGSPGTHSVWVCW